MAKKKKVAYLTRSKPYPLETWLEKSKNEKPTKIYPIAPGTLVKFDFDSLPMKMHSEYPFTKTDRFVFLNEIWNMPGHCVVVRTKDHNVFTCYHTDNFVVLTEDEI